MEELSRIEKLWNSILDVAASTGLKLLYAIVVLVVGLILVKKLTKAIARGKRLSRIDQGVKAFLASALRILLSFIVIILAAGIIGIPMSSFITILASAGVAVGLALQGALSNFAGGLMILLFKPFKIGDYIETTAHDGVVHDINVFYTVLVTYDNKHITLPNGTLTNAAIINHFTEPTRRADFVFTAAYSCDPKQVREVILQTAATVPFVKTEPALVTFLSKQSDSSLDFTLRVWCDTEHYWDVMGGMNEAMKTAFDENHISIPFPQLDIHLSR